MQLDEVRSLGFRSDLAMLAFEGVIRSNAGYLVAETPSNPGFYWGNLLLFPEPPKPGDGARWQKLFADAFAHRPEVKHQTFGWDTTTGDPGEVHEFLGFHVDETKVMTLKPAGLQLPLQHKPFLEVRALQSDDDWEAATLNQIASRAEGFELGPYENFKRRQMERYRRMTKAGMGNWYGAFRSGELWADCGLFSQEGLGRYQSVGTHPHHRRKGAAATLIFETARLGLQNADTLVICADPNYHAAGIYESVGFRETERQIGAYRRPLGD